VLKNDNHAIFTAASHTQRAAEFLNGFQPCRMTEPAAVTDAA
jgi:antirestriction protein ArdC